MVIGQKRKHSRITIRLVTLVSKCRRLVYLLYSSNVVQVPHVRSTVISTFPFEKVFPNLECGLDFFKHAAPERLRLRF